MSEEKCLCPLCKTLMVDAGHGIGFYCPNQECNDGELSIHDYKKIISRLKYGERVECEICGSQDKKPTSKYCYPCKTMIDAEHKILISEAWKKSIEIVRNKVKEGRG